MAQLIFDESLAAQESMLSAGPTPEQEQEDLVFDDKLAAEEAFQSAPAPEGVSPEGITYSDSMRELLGIPPKEEEAPTPTTEVAEPTVTPREEPEQIEAPNIEGADQAAIDTTNPLLRGTLRLGGAQVDPEAAGAGAETAVHRLKLGGEFMLLGAAELADFMSKLNNFATGGNIFEGEVFGDFEIPDMELNGIKINGPELASLTRESIVAAYGAAGFPEELEEIRDVGDIGVKLFAGNVGPALPIQLARSATKGILRNADEAADFVAGLTNKYLKTEIGISISGATAGTAAAAISGDDLQEKVAIAEMANLGGIGLHVIFDIAPTMAVARKLLKKKNEAKKFMEDGAAYDMAEEEVNKFIASMVTPEDLPAVRERMRIVREIQEVYPDFKPTVGNIIGSEESRKVQRLTDSASWEKATAQFNKTKASMDRMITALTTVSDPSQQVKIAAALKLFSKETSTHIVRMQDEIARLEESARRINTPGFKATRSGKEIRESIEVLKKQHRGLRDDLYAAIDPEDTVRFVPGTLLQKIEDLSNVKKGDRIIPKGEKGEGVTYLKETLPDTVRELRQRGVEDGLEYITFTELHNLRKQLGTRISNIARNEPTSNVPNVLTDIKAEIDVLIANKMISGDKNVAARFKQALEFYENEYLPTFIQGVNGKLLKRDTTNDFSVAAEDVGDKFWRPGQKTQNLEKFNETFALERKEKLGKWSNEATELAMDLARGNLKTHALQTLDDLLLKKPNTRPLDVLKEWKATFRGALNTFDDIADDVAKIEREMTDLESIRFARNDKITELNSEIIAKYADADASELIPKLFAGTPEETGRRLQDIFRASAKKGVDDFDERFPTSVDMTAKEVAPLLHAVKEGMMQHMLKRSYDADLGHTKWQTFDNFLNKSHPEHLKQVFTEKEIAGMHDFRDALKLMGNETKPVTKAELNKLKEVFDNLGFAPASVLSRYYSHQLGKVGGLYLVVDGATRIFTKVADKHFKQAYEAAMYDLDGLEKVLKHVGSKEAEDTAKALREGLNGKFKKVTNASKKAVQDFIADFFTQHKALAGFRLFETIEDVQQDTIGDLSQNYMLMNDDKTEQPSRMGINLNEGVTNEDLDKELEEFKQKRIEARTPSVDEEGLRTIVITRGIPQEELAKEPITETFNFGGE